VRSTEGVWVDSICYATMIGECFYQMGEPAKALDQYNSALKLSLAHKGWMLRVEFPDVIQPSASVVRNSITWGASQRNTQLARIPDRMSSFQGQMVTEQTIRAGGAIAQPQLYPLNAKEVIRCIALALRRRREIMGPVCPHDPLTAQLVADFATYPTRPNHWSQAWVSCLQGLAYASIGKLEQAVSELNKSLVLAGQYDHDLTSMALLELGKLAFQQGQSQAAAGYFLEATFPAMAFDQYDVMEEALRGGLVVHLVSGQPGPYPPLAPAAVWARRHSRALQAWLLLLAAENRAALGDAAAVTLLGETRQAVGTRDLRSGVLGARFNFVSAQVEFQRGNLAGGSTQLAQSLAFLKGSSHRLYQIGLADAAFVSGAVTQRVADDLYANVLREPTAADWAVDPMETLAVVLTPHPAPLQRWLEAAMGRKDVDKSLEIADRIRRHRFYSSLPLGGRLLSLRWILEAPESLLSQQAVLQRQDLLARYGNYAKLSAQAAAVRKELEPLPLAAQKPEDIRKQTQLFEQLAQTSASQELMLQDLALRREPSEFVFPPLRTVKEIQQSLSEEQLVLAYSVSDRYVLGFALSKNKSSAWQMESPAAVFKQASELLRQMGLVERKTGLDPASLTDEAWKTTAADLLKKLTNNGNPNAWDTYRELIVIPDGPLWYVPFEALQVPGTAGTVPLVSKVQIRYLPTAGLLTMGGSNPKPQAKTLVVTGPMVPGQDKQVTAGAFEAIQRSLDGVARAEDKLPASSHLVAAVCDRLIVLSDLEPSPRGPYGWSPMSLDRGKAGGTLDSWLTLPWQGPAEVVLPGFHTAAETGLKRGANGDEIFFAACGLMASGSRSILLSRWPTAGQSAFDLVREYVQELPFVPAAEAWQRSVQLLRDNPIAPELEPRLSSAGAAVELTAAPPFFWAGYMLVDLGRAPPAAPRAAPPPAAKPVPSDDPPEDAAPPAAAPGKKPKRD
jgi:tetratricopeptide (TPR) repeat protein